MAQTPLGNIGYEFEHTLGVDDWKNSYDANWVRADSIGGQAFVVDHLITAEPGSPAVGDAYIMAATQTGTNWTGDTGAIPDAIALFTNLPGQTDGSPWLYLTPRESWNVYDRTNDLPLFFTGSKWVVRGHLTRLPVKLGDTTGDFEPTIRIHANTLVIFTDAYDEINDALNIPDNATEPFPIGTEMEFFNDGDGDPITITDDVSVTWLGENLTTIQLGVGSRVSIRKTGTDEWAITNLYLVGQHTTNVDGFVSDPSINIDFVRVGDLITIGIPAFTGTSDAITMVTATALPAYLRPTNLLDIGAGRTQDGGAGGYGTLRMTSGGILEFSPDLLGGSYQNTLTKDWTIRTTHSYLFGS